MAGICYIVGLILVLPTIELARDSPALQKVAGER
jgi:hypothetical protein